MDLLPLRLRPGQDLRRALEAALSGHDCAAAFVVSGIGSLSEASLRFAGKSDTTPRREDLEILSLAGTVGAGGSHLHAALADSRGAVFGGHVGYGCLVRTTAEVLLGLLPEWEFGREPDPETGFLELAIRRAPAR